MIRSLALATAVLCGVSPALAGNWPNWRGPDNQGHCDEDKLPRRWGPKENVRWRVPLPDAGNSTPVVWGDNVFVTQATDKSVWPPKGGNGGVAAADTRSLFCFRRSDGRQLWRASVTYKDEESTHPTNPFCSASPATDGERVYVSFGSAGLYCYDLAGKEVWRANVGKMEHIWGNASSPVLYRDLCILWVGPGEDQVLLALDKRTGKEVWRHAEPGGASGVGGNKTWVGSWSTPVVVRVGDRDELILPVPEKVKGFDPATGVELWSCAGLSKLVYASPLVGKDGVVVAMSGYHGPALAVRAGGRGDVTATRRLWHHAQANPQRVGSGVIVADHLYILNDNGVAQCLEVATGKEVWAERLGPTWSSVVAAGDRLYVPNKQGGTYVLKATPKFELLAQNRLNEPMYASLAVSAGDVFVRTHKALWCVGDSK
jgi:outer membrane protein assembly factor BamB